MSARHETSTPSSTKRVKPRGVTKTRALEEAHHFPQGAISKSSIVIANRELTPSEAPEPSFALPLAKGKKPIKGATRLRNLISRGFLKSLRRKTVSRALFSRGRQKNPGTDIVSGKKKKKAFGRKTQDLMDGQRGHSIRYVTRVNRDFWGYYLYTSRELRGMEVRPERGGGGVGLAPKGKKRVQRDPKSTRCARGPYHRPFPKATSNVSGAHQSMKEKVFLTERKETEKKKNYTSKKIT